MQEISIEEFNDICNRVDIAEMQSDAYDRIVRFYTKYKWGDIFRVVGEKEKVQEVFRGCEDVYTKFNIVAEDINFLSYGVRNQICLVQDADTIKETIEQFREKKGFAPEYVAILSGNVDEAIAYVTENNPTCFVMNKITHKELVEETSRSDKYEYIDITQEVTASIAASVSPDFNLNKQRELLEDIRGREHESTTVFCIGSDVSSKVERVYLSLACILTFEGYNFEIPIQLRAVFSKMCVDTLSAAHRPLQDYLDELSHPVSFGFYQGRVGAFVCVLNRNGVAEYTPKELTFSAFVSKLDKETLQLCNRNVDTFNVIYSSIKVIDVIEAFELEDNSSGDSGRIRAIENHCRLNELLGEFESLLVESVGLSHLTALNLTNVLVFEFGEETFIGYVPRLPEVEYDYTFVPLCQEYTSFKRTLTRKEYDRILDINVLVERDSLMQVLGKYTYKEMQHFKKPRYLDGLMCQGLHVTKGLITEKSGMSFTEVGIWSIQTEQCRTTALQFLLTQFSRAELRNKRFLTYWGGCHPMDLVAITVNYKIWRNNNE